MVAASKHRPTSYYEGASSSTKSLVNDTLNDLSEESIQKILSYRLALPSKNRIAIINLSQDNYWQYYSSDFVSLNKEILNGFINNLNESPRIYDASFLPSLILPKSYSLANLRMAAARYQADVLMTYQTNCQNFEERKLIDPNVIRAYCTVEVMAIDIRSGIVSFTAVSTNDFTAKKADEDVNFHETRKKAEMKAISAGLTEVSSLMREFIEGMPKLGVRQ